MTLSLALSFASATSALSAPASLIELPGDRVFPESVTVGADGTLYVGSIPGGGIMRAPAGASKAEPFIKPGAGDSRSTFGVLADAASGTLWVCSNDVSSLGVAGPSSVKGSFLKGFDLTTGAIKTSVPLPERKSLCNDIAIGPDGAAYVTNSLAPDILRLRSGAKSFDVWATDPQFDPPAQGGAGLDGIAFGRDGNLYVTKFTDAALLRVEMKNGEAGAITKLEPSRPLALADALRPTEGGAAFLMIEGEGRLDRVTIDGAKAQIDVLKSDLNGPTGVAETGGTAWVSEGQLRYLFGREAGGPQLPFDLRAVSLAIH